MEQDKQIRNNFENAFYRYEKDIKTHTENLLQKLISRRIDINVNDEVVNLFTTKLLNCARNPFSIHKMLNTFGALTDYLPTSPEQQTPFNRILNGSKPHQKRLCHDFGISETEYEQWLRMLFMLFIPSGEGDLNMLESIVKTGFTDPRFEIGVLVSLYSSPQCLLSDRSFSSNIEKPGMDGFDFNLSSKAFIRYMFANIDEIVSSCKPPEILSAFKAERKKLPRQIQLNYCFNNMELLGGFNRNVIYQSNRHVYCASKTPFIF
ncbi:hypothetical protein [Methylomonas albis]|nr:hypothetical protein [Methylomonas albis]